MTLASGARAGVVLLIVGIPCSLLIAKGKSTALRWVGLLLGCLALLWVLVLLYPGTNTLGVRESFRFGEDARYAYLPDILYTLSQYWPVGSGLGSFVPVFTPNENLDLAGRAYLNHAHNDFLEWALETGILGVAWLAFSVIAIGYLASRKLKKSSADIGITMGALLLVTLASLHSLADYPLRTATLAVAFAYAAGMLCSSPTNAARDAAEYRGGTIRSRWVVVVAIILAVPVAVVALRSHLVQSAIRAKDVDTLAKLDPGNSIVLIEQSEGAFQRKQYRLAEGLAGRAVTLDPLSSPALRQLALAREANNQESNAAWQAASALGWRDAPTQLWAFKQGLLNNQLDIAAQRAGALLRTQAPDPALLSIIRSAAQRNDFARELAIRVRMDPPWRSSFFELPAKPSVAEVAGVSAVLSQLAKNKEAKRSDTRGLVNYFLNKQQWIAAIAVRHFSGGDADPDAILSDGGFSRSAEEYAGNSTAFDWQTLKGAHLSGNIETVPPSRLILDSDGEAGAMGAQRYLVVNPGNYSMSFDARSDNADSFRVRILCVNSSMEIATSLVGQSTSFKSQTLGFVVPVSCPLVRLAVESLPNGSPAMAEFDNFGVEQQYS
jgi:hypothetical protein